MAEQRKKRKSTRKKDPAMIAKMKEMSWKGNQVKKEKARMKREEPEYAELSPKELDFVTNFLYNDQTRSNAAKSYMAAYLCDIGVAMSRGAVKLREPHIKCYIDKAMKEIEETHSYMKNDIVNVLHKIMHEQADANPTDKEGNPVGTHLARRVAVSAAAEISKICGFNAPTKVESENKHNFVFNLHVPKDEDEDTTLELDQAFDEFEDAEEIEDEKDEG